MIVAVEPSEPISYLSTESDALFHHERDDLNLIKSGREWFQEISSININPGFTDLLAFEKNKIQNTGSCKGFGSYLLQYL